MGIQDRDYYREKRDEATWGNERRSGRRSCHIPVDLLAHANRPKLWGAEWHWSLKALVWLAMLILILLARRLLS